jgi:hypothetical protein
MADLPGIILWAWERPENLSFIDTGEVGIAFLATTLYLKDDRVIIRPRLQPLSAPAGAKLIAVVRIESPREARPALSEAQRARAAEAIVEASRAREAAAVQIDFDARESERGFYRALLFDVRKRLPHAARLSITALASWCLGDNWLDGLPVDEAVPMLFRMGVDTRNVVEHLKSKSEFRAAPARSSLGISIDEPLIGLPPGKRVYVFNPRSWTPEEVARTVREVKLWQSAKD